MDLGFAGLIEKIEEHCGKRVASALLWVLAFLVFAWALDFLFTRLESVYTLMENGEGFKWTHLLDIGFSLAAITGISVAISETAWRYSKSRVEKDIQRARDYEEEVKLRVEKIVSDLEERKRSEEEER